MVAEAPATSGWRTIAGPGGKGHFIRVDGTTACADLHGPWGVKMGQLFTRPWRDSDPRDHFCALCRKTVPRECFCGRPQCKPWPTQQEVG